MSIIKGKVLYSRDKLDEPEVDLRAHPNFGEFILSHLKTDPAILDQVWLVNAGCDLTGVNRASCGRVLRKYGELEQLSRAVGATLAQLGVGYGSIVQVRRRSFILHAILIFQVETLSTLFFARSWVQIPALIGFHQQFMLVD